MHIGLSRGHPGGSGGRRVQSCRERGRLNGRLRCRTRLVAAQDGLGGRPAVRRDIGQRTRSHAGGPRAPAGRRRASGRRVRSVAVAGHRRALAGADDAGVGPRRTRQLVRGAQRAVVARLARRLDVPEQAVVARGADELRRRSVGRGRRGVGGVVGRHVADGDLRAVRRDASGEAPRRAEGGHAGAGGAFRAGSARGLGHAVGAVVASCARDARERDYVAIGAKTTLV